MLITAGRDLQSMTLYELVQLYQHCAGDDQDSAVLSRLIPTVCMAKHGGKQVYTQVPGKTE